ncbi:MAG: adenine phosphoribosyltransferase [Candidatus Omnitrophica bacterium]|nr:adenine phosphoribosyltransferase [Candidatus Omnitrophota bacterium]
MDLKTFIRDVPGYPKPGIVFKDITPLWKDPRAFRFMVDGLVDHFKGKGIQVVASIESRGFIVGSAVAFALGAGFVPIRKAGKLPWNTVKASYSLEYGEATSEVHTDAFQPGARVLLLDDLLATGGTAEAAMKLLAELKAEVAGMGFIVELGFLKGREKLAPLGAEIFSLIRYE